MNIEWNDYFYYDRSSPSSLKWKVDVRTGKNLNRVIVAKGDDAGCIFEANGRLYWRVRLNGKATFVHRVVHYLFNGSLESKMIIDHIDGDGLNNNINNLRVVSHGINSRNKSKSKNNSSGITGVHIRNILTSYNTTSTYWIASYTDLLGKSKSKCFSTNKYGYNEAFRLACEWRQKMIIELNAQGAGYTERHGKDLERDM